MEEIKDGDVVRLKSGGPDMTVIYVNRSSPSGAKAACEWFVNGIHQTIEFQVTSLEKVDQPSAK